MSLFYDGLCMFATGVAVLLVVVVVRAVFAFYQQRAHAAALSSYKGPAPDGAFGMWGNAQYRTRHHGRLHVFHMDNIAKYCKDENGCYRLLGPSFMHSVSGSRHDLITADPVFAKHVLSDHFDSWGKSNPGGRVFSSIIDWLGVGIFTIDHGPDAEFPRDGGRMWHAQRRTAAAIFTRQLFKTFYQNVFLSHTQSLVSILKEKAGPRGENPIDFQYWMHALTMDCFGEIAFGKNLGNLSGEDEGFGKSFDMAHNQVLLFVGRHVKELVLRELLPTALGDVVQKYLIEGFSSVHAELRRHNSVMHQYTQQLIDEKRATLTTRQDNDLLSMFLRMEPSAEDGISFTDKTLRDLVVNFMIAGRDTTACTLSWLFYRLGLPEHRHILTTLQAEVDAVLQGAAPTHDDISDMPYLRGCLFEAMRLHPVVPFVSVVAKKDDVLPDGVRVPCGTKMLVAVYAMGRSRKIHGEDALEFRPERWIPFQQPSPFEFPVFKAGRRICLGKDMAMFEATVVAATMLQNFTPEVVRPEAVTFGAKITMNCKDTTTGGDELWLRMRPRQAPSP